MSPFTGSIEFRLAMEVFDVRVVRKARVDYAYSPAWPYCDTQSCEERIGNFQLEIGLSVLTQPRSVGTSRASHGPKNQYWAPLGRLLTVGVLRTKVYDQQRARIDAEARDADRRHRLRIGWPAPDPPEQI